MKKEGQKKAVQIITSTLKEPFCIGFYRAERHNIEESNYYW